MIKNRVNLTSEVGVDILNLKINNNLKWIIRNTTNTDVGIDATIEQVIDGDPKAKYISVQLKTGLSNVKENKNGDFIFYFDEIHYKYWLSSFIPIILVLCDPKTEILYWEEIIERNIKHKRKGYALTIKKSSILNEDTIVIFNDLIRLSQDKNVLVSDLNEMDDKECLDYIDNLFDNCRDGIKLVTEEMNKIGEVIRNGNMKLEQFILSNLETGCTKQESKKHINGICREQTLKINICTNRINQEYPIIIQTHIEAVRLFEKLILDNNKIDQSISQYIGVSMSKEAQEIRNLIELCLKFKDRFKSSPYSTTELINSEKRFCMVISDYAANLKLLLNIIQKSRDNFACSE